MAIHASAGVEAVIRYASPTDADGGDVFTKETAGGKRDVEVFVRNGRQDRAFCADDAHVRWLLNMRGFALVDFRSSQQADLHLVENPIAYRNDKDVPESPRSREVREVFFHECVELVKRVAQPDYAFALSYAVRAGSKGKKAVGVEYLTAYASFAHCDYSDSLAAGGRDQAMLRKLGVSEAELAEGVDVAFYNVWVPTSHEVQQYPLGLLDARSVSTSDVVKQAMAYDVPQRGRSNGVEIARIVHNDAHRWFYFPRMQLDEAVLFTQLDLRSKHGSSAKQCFHTAFFDPTAPADAVRRTSIEVRVICGFRRPINSRL